MEVKVENLKFYVYSNSCKILTGGGGSVIRNPLPLPFQNTGSAPSN